MEYGSAICNQEVSALIHQQPCLDFSGIPLGATEETEVVLFTASLAISILDISSTFAQNLTGGLWDASIGTEDDNLPEAPPGGRLLDHGIYLSVLWSYYSIPLCVVGWLHPS